MIVVDGNDGTGKTTLAKSLREMGFLVCDRGLPTYATDHGLPDELPENELYLILDAPVEVCHKRIMADGRDPDERYHNLRDLSHYRFRFINVAESLGVVPLNAELPLSEVLHQALARIGVPGPLRVGVPKGRLFASISAALADCGHGLHLPENRQLKVKSGWIDFFLVKPRSIPQLVALGYLNAGFCGRDLMMESGCEEHLRVAVDLQKDKVTLCVATHDPDLVLNPPPRPLAIATEFPRLASRWAYSQNLAHLCLQTWGSTEAWVPELADIVVDVVETGQTLKDNGLTLLHTITESTTLLIERKANPIMVHTELGNALGAK